MTARLRLFVLAAVGLTLPACGATDGSVSLHEFAIDVGSEISSTVPVVVRNEGDFGHTLVVADASGDVVASTEVIAPGEDAELVADLDPGVYELTCRIVIQLDDGRLVDHMAEGMIERVVVES